MHSTALPEPRPASYAAAAPLALLFLVLLSNWAAPSARAQEQSALWAALRQPGHFVIMRHALAPGTGDPDNFRLDDCGTQRNLSEGGRQQARRTGDAFRANGVLAASIYSSLWCRCLETARLLDLGAVSPLPSLNSFFEDRGKGPAQIRQLRQDILAMDLSRPAVLVTHQVNVTGLTGVYPRSGEMIVMRRTASAELEVVGRLRPLDAG